VLGIKRTSENTDTHLFASMLFRAQNKQNISHSLFKSHGAPPPPTVTLLDHRTLVGGLVIAPLAAGGQWSTPFETPAHLHHVLQPSWQLLAVRRATVRAPAILVPGEGEMPAADTGGMRRDVSRRGLEAMSERAGDAHLDARAVIEDFCLARSTPAQRCHA
jgi:hypothetical protein